MLPASLLKHDGLEDLGTGSRSIPAYGTSAVDCDQPTSMRPGNLPKEYTPTESEPGRLAHDYLLPCDPVSKTHGAVRREKSSPRTGYTSQCAN